MDGRPSPIEPDGLLDGIRWSAVVRGAILDNVLTVVASIPLMLFFAGAGALAEDDAAAERSFDQAFSSAEFLLAFFVVGISITVYAGFWAARRAGVLPLRHGGWTAIVSLAIATLFLLLPGASEGSTTPIWYDALSFALMLPAGVLGGWLASRVPAS